MVQLKRILNELDASYFQLFSTLHTDTPITRSGATMNRGPWLLWKPSSQGKNLTTVTWNKVRQYFTKYKYAVELHNFETCYYIQNGLEI